jgi:hypothetical protein
VESEQDERRSGVSALRILRRPRVVLVAAVTAAIVATDLAASGVGGFWGRHPMAAGVVSGLLLLGIGVWIVEGWVVEHSKPIVRQAYRSLASDLGTVAFVMRWCVLGTKGRPGSVPVGTGVDADCLRALTTPLANAPADGGYMKRLKHLARDDEWRAATVDVMRECRRRLHDASRGWTAVMLASPELTDDLGEVANLTEEIGRLNGALADEDIVDEVVGAWQSVQSQAIALEKRFYKAAREGRLSPLHEEPYQPKRRRERAEAEQASP